MIEVPVYNTDGAGAGHISVDEVWFGGKVKMDILRLAVRHYESTRRQGTVALQDRRSGSRKPGRGSQPGLFRKHGRFLLRD